MAVITVTTTADSGSGSLRAAIASAQSGDTIRFASALTNQTIVLTSGQLRLSAGKVLTIDGSDAANLTISGNQSSRILLVDSTSATPTQLLIRQLTLANGYTAERGGAISTAHQTALTVENVAFVNNIADDGGGAIFSAFEGTLTVTGSQFTGNKAIAGNDERGAGAIAFWGPRSLTVRNSTFTNNRGINGGAINSLNGKLIIENSTFTDNDTLSATYDSGQPNPTLRGYGGAIYTDRASSSGEASGFIQITNSTFEGNQGRGEGGAAYLYTGTQDQVTITDSLFKDNSVLALSQGNGGNGGAIVQMTNGLNKGFTISDTSFVNNTASSQGGGLWVMGASTSVTNSTFSGNKTLGADYNRVGGAMALYSPTTIINSTIANNHAGWVGGGISASDGTPVSVQNTIFYANTADNGTNNWGIQQHTNRQIGDQGGNIQWPPKRTTNWNDYNATASVRLVDPLLGPLQDNGGGLLTHALLPGSPAIDAGKAAGAPLVDQRGALRDTLPDSGAFELSLGVFTLVGSDGDDALSGTLGRDALSGGLGNDTIQGFEEADVLLGGEGSDRLQGGTGADRLVGGNGNDSLIGGAGRDTLNGGQGRDRFILTAFSDKVDVIEDFNRRQDKIDLSQIVTGRAFRSRRPFDTYLQIKQMGSRTLISFDANGDRAPDRFKALISLNNFKADTLSAQQFIF